MRFLVGSNKQHALMDTNAVFTSPDELKKLIQKTRPNFERIKKATTEALSLYYGEDELYNLIKILPKEEDEKYQIRKKAVAETARNYLKEIAETFVEGVFFTRAPKRKGANVLNDWFNGEYHRFFVEEFAPFSLFVPELFIQIGAHKSGAEIKSAYAQKEAKAYPTLAVHLPHKVQAFGCDEGRVTWVLLEKGEGDTATYEYYNDTQFLEINKKGEILNREEAQQKHGFNRCPFVRAVYRENKALPGIPRVGHAYLSGVVARAKGALEHVSQLWEAVYFHLHPKFMSNAETIAQMMESGFGAGIPNIEKPGPTGVLPSRYLDMPNTEIEQLMRITFEEDPKAIYAEARVRDRTAEGALTSGASKAMDLVPQVKALKQVAGFWQSVDEAVMDICSNGQTDTVSESVAEYPSSFDTKGPAETVNEIAAVAKAMKDGGLPQSATASVALSTKLYDVLLPDLGKDVMNTIVNELKAAVAEPSPEPEPDPLDPAKESLVPPDEEEDPENAPEPLPATGGKLPKAPKKAAGKKLPPPPKKKAGFPKKAGTV